METRGGALGASSHTVTAEFRVVLTPHAWSFSINSVEISMEESF